MARIILEEKELFKVEGFRLLIAGSRGFPEEVFWQIMEGYSGMPDVLINGKSPGGGVDLYGEEWARIKGIPVEEYPPNFTKFGKSAGHIRNKRMAEVCTEAMIFWDGYSPGTYGMIGEILREKKVRPELKYRLFLCQPL